MFYRKYDGSAAAQTAAPVSDKFGTDAVETFTGTAAHESFWLGKGDTAIGGAGDDTYYLQGHNTKIIEAAGGGVDKIVAWSSVDLSKYQNIENVTVGNDGTYAAGNDGDNIVEGQAGAQQIYGGKGQDILIGGAGKDVFIVIKGEGNDVIQDFSAAEDKVRLKAGLSSFEQVKARMTQVGSDVNLDLGNGDALMFRNITIDKFTASNFQLELNHNTLGQQTFADEFSGPLSIWDAQSNPTGTWRPDFGYQGEQGTGSYTLMSNDEKQIYTSPYFRGHNGTFSENPFVTNADGTLSIWARPSTNSEIFGYGYTSGMITTKESHSQTYGYFEMRADIPEAAGAWPAFWLIPTDGSWPPELDVMESLTSDPNGLWTTQHSSLGGHTANGQLSYVPNTADGFHTYGAMWSPTEIVWYVDNVEVFRTATPADMNKPMFMIANLALGGWGGAIDGAALPAEFKIDYIRAWSLGDASAAPSNPPPSGNPPPAGDPPPTPAPPPVAGEGMALTSQAFGDVLTGGAGADTLTAGNGGEQMTGGAGGDVFVFARVPWSPTEIKDFQVGVDRLDISALLNGAAAAERVLLLDDGAGGTKVCVDPDGPGGAWPDYIAHLQGVPLSSVTVESLLRSAAGTTPPAPTPPTSGVAGASLTSSGFGSTLAGGAGADTIIGGNGGEQMTGGAGGDMFVFKTVPWSPAEIKDFEVGVDRLDLSALFNGYQGADPIADGRLYLFDDGAGGTKVCVDPDGFGGAWPDYIAHLQGVPVAGLTAATLLGVATAPAAAPAAPAAPPVVPGVNLVSTSTNKSQTLTGGDGADTLNAGRGADVLTGAGGADRFVFDELPWKASRVTDFTPGEDKLDVSGLLSSVGYKGSDPLGDGFVKVLDNGQGGAWVYFDTDGAAGAKDKWGTFVTTLDNVSPTSLKAIDWIF
ncbi:family 16 glycosylhydrolase [Phenylobacterium sp. J426]|uniref:family 16 glycosylhydrolase n=1 Tax=Phenylobacterium sp. J426 TaxID=2898439 RepID=UPI0021507021|nr:family 16 glycosylhydrolase [Phenylobacterium sp. J426]MCR5875426.1 family 16 glycosylhydrolase [Phenylobacterium sp. J426]